MITNEQNAWRKYNLTINTAPYFYPSFGIINNMTAIEGKQTEIKLNLQSSFDIQVVDWANDNLISWIQFVKQNLTLIFNLINRNTKTQCARLLSNDSCNSKVFSNNFTIFVVPFVNSPPILANKFGPLKLYTGQKKIFLIPEDLFLTSQSEPLKYSVGVLNWSISSFLLVNVSFSKLDNSSYLYVNSKDPKSCFFVLSATDSSNQAAEIIIEIDVLNWASKDWIEWNSQYQSDWTKCIQNYVLEPSGGCYQITV